MSDQNPFFEAALESSSPNNVTGTLTFLLTRILTTRDVSQVYSPDLIRAVAAVSENEARDTQRRLKALFGKDMNSNHWWKDVKEAKAGLLTALPSDLQVGANGPKANLANAIVVLRKVCKLGFDKFSNRVVLLEPSPWGPARVWCDDDDISAVNYLQHHDVGVSNPQVANDAARFVSKENEFHPVKDWLAGLKWDGKHRLDSWMYRYLGAKGDIGYLSSICSKWCISAVARIFQPGCQAKAMIVLEGDQDVGKSKALRALTNGHLSGDTGIQWFRDSIPDIEHKEIGSYMQGVWIIEIAELAAIRGKQWEKVKNFVSLQNDFFRRSYGRNHQDYPRQCIFSASTNETRWGGDPTGLVRFWPTFVTAVDVDGILAEREQLWAEATHRYMAGEQWWLDDDEKALAKMEQDNRQPEDTWLERVGRAVPPLSSEITITEVMDKMGVAHEKQEVVSFKVSRALITLGWNRQRADKGWVYVKG